MRDEGVAGVVLRLSESVFAEIVVEGKRVRAGAGAAVSALISQTARHGLAGLETLVGIPGTVGGASAPTPATGPATSASSSASSW